MKQIICDSEKKVLLSRSRDRICFLCGERKAVMKRTNEVSKLAGISRRTLQYYDDEGILVTERSRNNHRLYDKEALEKIWEIMLYKEMGFELKEIRQLLQATDNKKKEYLRRKIEIVRGDIKKREEQIEFISLILGHGIPHMPEESDGMTYVKSIEELRRKL